MNALPTSSACTLIDACLLTKQQFDRISDIHEQQEFTGEEVAAIGKIFHSHGVVHKYGLQLLHRHFTLPEETLVLTEPVEPGILVSKVTPVDQVDLTNIRGQLYYLNDDGKFQAYEYEYGSPIDIPEAFLKDLALFVEQHNMRDRFALASTTTEPGSKPFKEWEVGSQATVVAEGDRALVTEGTAIKVSYRFEAPETTEGHPPIAKLGGGHETSVKTGNHSVLYMQGSCSALRSDEPFDFDKVNIVEVLRENGLIQ